MKTVVLIALAVGAFALLVLLYHRHHRGAAGHGTVVHVRNEFEFTARAPYQVLAPLFGAEGERAWSGGNWDPHFLYPQPAEDIQGAVFTIHHGHRQAYWINTSFDKSARHFQYVYVIPEAMVVLIDVRFSEVDAANTKVNVAYERTALDPGANAHVQELGNADRQGGREWGTAVNDYLAKQKDVSRR
jgi:hypothetical protein